MSKMFATANEALDCIMTDRHTLERYADRMHDLTVHAGQIVTGKGALLGVQKVNLTHADFPGTEVPRLYVYQGTEPTAVDDTYFALRHSRHGTDKRVHLVECDSANPNYLQYDVSLPFASFDRHDFGDGGLEIYGIKNIKEQHVNAIIKLVQTIDEQTAPLTTDAHRLLGRHFFPTLLHDDPTGGLEPGKIYNVREAVPQALLL